jgi:spermidine dehydrogenase
MTVGDCGFRLTKNCDFGGHARRNTFHYQGTTPFATYERRVREELTHLFGPWGFRAAEDIVAITINRWAPGYTFASLPGGRKPAPRAGRAQLGRTSFASADMGGEPWTQLAVQEGRRAALEPL